MSKLLDLLPEIHEEIFKKCAASDLGSLAQCSWSANAAVKEQLWRNLVVSLDSLLRVDWRKNVDKKKLDHLKHTRHLSIGNRKEYCLDKVIRENRAKVLSRYQKIVLHCDPNVLESLQTNLGGFLVPYACQVLTALQILDLSFTFTLDTPCFVEMNNLKNLRQLDLSHTNTEDDHLRSLTSNIIPRHLTGVTSSEAI
jgi:hypothetical protein